MRKISLIAALILLLLLTGALLLILREQATMESDVRTFNTIADMRRFAGELDWWIPDFLPPSSHDIKEMRNFDYNTGIMHLEFDPKEYDFFALRVKQVPEELWTKIAPQWVFSRSEVFPSSVLHGRFQGFLLDGFQVAGVNSDKMRQRRQWYILVHPEKGIMYTWSVNSDSR